MFESGQVTQKVKTEVELTLTDGSVLGGEMFMHADQRVLDLLNDDRRFVPFETFDGAISVINKSVIAKITPLEQGVRAAKAVVAFGH